MTTKYAADGQICEAVLDKRMKKDSGIALSAVFSWDEIKQLMDELAPKAERGRDLTGFLDTYSRTHNCEPHNQSVLRVKKTSIHLNRNDEAFCTIRF
jgi:hypothetical protein